MKYYKYIANLDAVKSIISGKLKFATIESLNDPTELLPKIIESELKESLAQIRKNGYTKDDLLDLKHQEAIFNVLSPETRIIEAPRTIEDANGIVQMSIYNDFKYLKDMFSRTVNLIGTRCGILCISHRSNSLPMWAHYANNAKGYLIEFNDLEKEFCGDETGLLNKITPIKYRKNKTGVSFKAESYKSIFFEKNIDWEYENESRVVTSLSSCDVTDNENGKIYTRSISKDRISRVIIGWKHPKDCVEKLTNELKSINRNIKVDVSAIKDGEIVAV